MKSDDTRYRGVSQGRHQGPRQMQPADGQIARVVFGNARKRPRGIHLRRRTRIATAAPQGLPVVITRRRHAAKHPPAPTHTSHRRHEITFFTLAGRRRPKHAVCDGWRGKIDREATGSLLGVRKSTCRGVRFCPTEGRISWIHRRHQQNVARQVAIEQIGATLSHSLEKVATIVGILPPQ